MKLGVGLRAARAAEAQSASMPPAGATGAQVKTAVATALARTNDLLVAVAKAQIIALGELPAGNDDTEGVANELHELVAERVAAAAEQAGEQDGEEEDDENGGEDDEEGDEEGGEDDEEGGEGDDGGGVSAKLDEVKELLERDKSQHEDFVNIEPKSKCGVCGERNGSYGCFDCNVRVCWHPKCLRDHLALNKGNKARASAPMIRKERKPASGSTKNHFEQEEEPAPAPAAARKKRKQR